MDSAQAQYTADQVLHAFRHDEVYLFLGSAFTTVGIVCVGYFLLRKRFEKLLVWLALFATLYGVRMWLQSNLMGLELAGNLVLERIAVAIDFLIPIPGFEFLRAAGFAGRSGEKKRLRLNALFVVLAILALIYGPLPALYTVNGVVVTIYLWMLLAQSLGKRIKNKELNAARIGVLGFIVLALFDNTIG